MDFIRPAYLNPAEVPESIRNKIPWMVKLYKKGLVGPAPKPSSREDGVYCISCAMWDIDGQSRQYRPKPRTPELQPQDPLAFRYDPASTNLRRMISRIAIGDPKEESPRTVSTSVANNQASGTRVTKLDTASRTAEAYETSYHKPHSNSIDKGKDKETVLVPAPATQYVQPALDHDLDTFDGNPVYVNNLALMKLCQHFCPLCHLVLKSLEGYPELEGRPWGDETMVLIDRFEFAVLFDDDKIKKDAEPRTNPRWPGLNDSIMGKLHQHTRLRQAKANALPERLAYRFCVRLDTLEHPKIDTKRRFGIQRLGELGTNLSDARLCGLQGRLIGQGEERMQRWLMWSSLCIERHLESCFPNFIHDDYPNLRLVDVHRRCVVDHLESQIYTALSYVWGMEISLVLNTANYAELHIPGSLADDRKDIPRTIRDVLNLCQNVSDFISSGGARLEKMDRFLPLAWRYIWIDALCIVQDDPTDKQHHISRMDKVYLGAWQTIVAASKEGAKAGLLGVGKVIPEVEQHVEHIDGIPFVATKQSFLTALTESKWETRGWTYQEKHLSKRLLVFGEEQCYWHCNCAIWYEDTNLEFPNDSYTHLRTALRHPDDLTKDPKKHLKWDPDQSDLDRYCMLADSYVRRKLKYDSDGLDSIKAVFTALIDRDGAEAGEDRSRDNMLDVLWSPTRRKYFWALPEIYLPAFLTTNWTTEDPWSERRNHYPTWSWLSRSLIDSGDEIHSRHIPPSEVTPRVPFYRFDDQGKPVMLECVQVYKSGITPSEDEFDDIDDKHANIPSILLVDDDAEAERLNKEHEEQGKNVLALNKSRTPQISHILAFRETTCKLWVDTEPIQMKPEDLCEDAPDSVPFEVRFADGGPTIGLIFLHRVWRRRQPQWLDFVVVTKAAEFVPNRCINFLCVEWDGPIVRRVQSLIAVKINEASAAHPNERKLVLLA